MIQRARILMLTTQLGYGGAETSFIRLANFLAQSMEVTIALFTRDYGNGGYASGHEPLNVSLLLLDSAQPCGRVRRWRQRIVSVRKLKQRHDVTISFLSGPNFVNVLAGCNHASIVSLRGSRRYDPVAPLFNRLLFQYLIDPVVFRLAARIVPVCAGLGNEVRQAAGERALSKLCVIPPFIDNAALAARLAEPPAAPYGELRGQKVIIAVGRLSPEKGFHHLIRVFSALSKTCPGIKLLLVGDGPSLPLLRKSCMALGLRMDDTTPGATSVLFAGYQQNPLPLMVLASVYALTSATEGFPSVLLEAMAANIPVIAADTPWGARSILYDHVMPSVNPYPTLRPTPADYGIIMPRIDALEYEAAWVETLAACLDGVLVGKSEKCARASDYDIAAIGKKWHDLIQTLKDSPQR